MNKNAPLSSQVKNILRARPTQLLFARVIIASCAFVTLPVTLSKQGRGRMCRKANLEDSYRSSFLPLLILSNSHFRAFTEQKTFPKRCLPNRIFKTWDCFSKGQTCISQLNYIRVQRVLKWGRRPGFSSAPHSQHPRSQLEQLCSTLLCFSLSLCLNKGFQGSVKAWTYTKWSLGFPASWVALTGWIRLMLEENPFSALSKMMAFCSK